MKKTTLKILATILVVIMFATLLAGCRNDPESNFVPPDYVFVPDILQLPEGIVDIRNLIYTDNTLFFSSYFMVNEETWEYATKLYSMNLDGTNITELPNYVSGANPFEDALGSMYLMAMNMDNEGNLWVTETGSFYRFNLPEGFDGEDWEQWDYYEPLDSIISIRKLDTTGAELLSLDISAISAGREWFNVNAFNIDSSGNLYIGANEEIFVLNDQGNMQFSLEVANWVEALIRLPDGSVGYFGWNDGGPDGHGYSLRKIDPIARAWGETVDLPQNAWNIFPGGGDYSILFSDGNNLFGIEAESGESVKVLNWIDSNVIIEGLNNVSILPDGRIMCTNQRYNSRTQESNFELVLLTRIPYSELPVRKVLTMATIWLNWDLRNHIVTFNQTNQNYRIHVIDYSEFNNEDDWNAGLTRLTTEIISGNVPDILDVSNLPFNQYVARGLLVDLYPLIDADPLLNRSDLMESALRVAEMDGGLYRAFPSFNISTIAGSPSVLGPSIGWNIDEFIDVLNANPQADMPMGRWLTNESFLQNAVWFSIDEYVDWATGDVSFDDGSFAQLLEFSSRFPSEIDYGDDMGFYEEENDLIATGRQIMSSMWLGDFQWMQMYKAMYGGELVFKGFPTENRNGNSLSLNASIAITSQASDKDGAWEFIRPLFTSEWQNANISHSFPTNKSSFDEFVKQAMEEPEGEHWMGMGRGESILIGAVTQAEVDKVLELIENSSGIASYDEALMNIIMEGAKDFFSGRSSANDAARIIQNRASIYISEQS